MSVTNLSQRATDSSGNGSRLVRIRASRVSSSGFHSSCLASRMPSTRRCVRLRLFSELLATHSASGVRKALVSKFEELSMHFFPRGHSRVFFKMCSWLLDDDQAAIHARDVRFVEHARQSSSMVLPIPANGEAWTRFLLTHCAEIETVEVAERYRHLNDSARLHVLASRS